MTDNRLDAAIVFTNKDIVVHNRGRGDGFVRVELSELVVYSCHCSPNADYRYFETFIAELDRDIKLSKLRSKQVTVGDGFNAKATEWGSPTDDRRGSLMTEWLSEANMVVLDQGNQPTFVRYNQESYIDVTSCTGGVVELEGVG